MTPASVFAIPFYLAAAILIVGGVCALGGVERRPGETEGDLVRQWLASWGIAAILVFIGTLLQHL
jgi:hypothetical protein